MHDGETMLAQLKADPDNDTLRLIYADWLEEQGDVAEAKRFRKDRHAAVERYRPSNGTDGMCFQEAFCYRCRHDSERRPCRILGLTMLHDVDDPNYPPEWRYVQGHPTCTKFSDRESYVAPVRQKHKPGKGQMTFELVEAT